MKLLVLGGSGLVGQELLKQLPGRGHHVRCLVRPSTQFAVADGVELIRAGVLEEGALRRPVQGMDGVLCALGIKRKSVMNPWSQLVSPPDFSEQVARKLVDAMNAGGVKRVVWVSAAGVGDSAAVMNGLMTFLVSKSNVGVAYRDLAKAEEVYRASGLDWHACRPTRLTNGPLTGTARIVDSFGMTSAISRADVAAWMIDRMEKGDLEPRTPMISSG